MIQVIHFSGILYSWDKTIFDQIQNNPPYGGGGLNFVFVGKTFPLLHGEFDGIFGFKGKHVL